MKRSLCLLALVVAVNTVRADEVKSTPAGAAFRARIDALAGKALVTCRSLDALILALQKDDQKQLARACLRLGCGYAQLADHLVGTASLVGETHARLERTRSLLTRLKTDLDHTSASRGLEEIKVLCKDSRLELELLRGRYRCASGEDKPALVAEMRQIVESLETLDRFRGLLEAGEKSLVPAAALIRLVRMERNLTTQLAMEERLVVDLTRTLRASLTTLPARLQTCVRMVQVKSALPIEQIAKLREGREALKQFAGKLQDARKDLSKAQIDAVPTVTTGSLTEEEVVRRADAFLKVR